MSELDRIIESALATYSSAGHSKDLEQRILDNALIQRKPIWQWGSALTAGVALLIAAWAFKRPAVMPVTHVAVVERPALRAPALVHTVSRPLARQKIIRPFPLPMPVSKEEKALLELLRENPEVLARPARENLRIDPLEIEPLSIGGNSIGEPNAQ